MKRRDLLLKTFVADVLAVFKRYQKLFQDDGIAIFDVEGRTNQVKSQVRFLLVRRNLKADLHVHLLMIFTEQWPLLVFLVITEYDHVNGLPKLLQVSSNCI